MYCMELILHFSPILSKEGGGNPNEIPISKKGGGIPILRNDSPNITFLSLRKIHSVVANPTQTYAQYLHKPFFCMPAIHSGVVILKTIVH